MAVVASFPIQQHAREPMRSRRPSITGLETHLAAVRFRQKRVMKWALENFGPIAANRDERAARLAEEAIEVAQAEGVLISAIQRIADRVYSRPPGDLGREIGGVAITLDALAENAGLNARDEGDRELCRVLSLPKDHWRRKHAEKVVAGTADLTPPPAANIGDPTY